MTKVERDKICKTCKNQITDDRFGILCGLTKNIPNFQDTCKDYDKVVTAPVFVNESRSIYKKKDKRGVKSFLGAGISLWLIFKLIMLLIKFFNR